MQGWAHDVANHDAPSPQPNVVALSGMSALRPIAVIATDVYRARMPFAQKLILHSPVSNESLLEEFVEKCLADRVSLLAICGPGSNLLEDIVDLLVIGDGSRPDRFLCTTSHPDEPLDEVLAMTNAWETDKGGTVELVELQSAMGSTAVADAEGR